MPLLPAPMAAEIASMEASVIAEVRLKIDNCSSARRLPNPSITRFPTLTYKIDIHPKRCRLDYALDLSLLRSRRFLLTLISPVFWLWSSLRILVLVVTRYTKESSSILVGFNYHTAPIEIREKLSVPEAQWPQAIGELCALNHIEEADVLSTCNRMEIYVVALSRHRGIKEVTEWMSKIIAVAVFISVMLFIWILN